MLPTPAPGRRRCRRPSARSRRGRRRRLPDGNAAPFAPCAESPARLFGATTPGAKGRGSPPGHCFRDRATNEEVVREKCPGRHARRRARAPGRPRPRQTQIRQREGTWRREASSRPHCSFRAGGKPRRTAKVPERSCASERARGARRSRAYNAMGLHHTLLRPGRDGSRGRPACRLLMLPTPAPGRRRCRRPSARSRRGRRRRLPDGNAAPFAPCAESPAWWFGASTLNAKGRESPPGHCFRDRATNEEAVQEKCPGRHVRRRACAPGHPPQTHMR